MASSSIEEIIAAQNQPFKCASFSGGGAKGAIYWEHMKLYLKEEFLKALRLLLVLQQVL